MDMVDERYQEYISLIGKLKDAFKLHVDVDHRNIHSFYQDKKPLFKLFFGILSKETESSIVVSFHIDLLHTEAIRWFWKLKRLQPDLNLHESFIEDSNGETYLGEDAAALKETYQAQEILTQWLEHSTKEEMEKFSQAPVLGRERDPKQSFDSQTQQTEAIIEFERLRKPSDDEPVH